MGVPDKNGRRYGGIADVLSHEVVKPLQRSMKQFSDSFAKWFKDDFFNPLAGALKPVATYMKGQLKDAIRSTTTYLFKTIKERFGIVDKISEYTDKLFSFGRRGLGKITEFIGNLGVGKKIGDKLRSLRDKSVSTFGRANYERGYDYDYDETLDDRVQKARKTGWNDKDSVMYNYENAINSRSKSDLSEDMDQELIQLRDSIKQYRSNKRIISNTRNKALRDARDELKSTGYRMARRYEASGEDLVHPYTAKKKILYFVKKISNISGADGDKALLNIADIETELRQEEDKLNTYIKNTNATSVVYQEIAENIVPISMHKHGCCVLQKCIERAGGKEQQQLFSLLLYNCKDLIIDQCGNYIIQFMITLNIDEININVANQLSSDIENFSKQKYASNVVEKCLECGSDPICDLIIKALLKANCVVSLLFDKFGNYVVQKALQRADQVTQQNMLNIIAPHLQKLKNFPFGMKLYSKLIITYSYLSMIILGKIDDGPKQGVNPLYEEDK